jgi:hypothetical protein
VGRLAIADLARRTRPADATLAELADRVADECAARFDLTAVGGRVAVDRMLRDLAARQDVEADLPTLALATLVCGCLLRAGRPGREHWEDHLDLLVGVLRRHRPEPTA